MATTVDKPVDCVNNALQFNVIETSSRGVEDDVVIQMFARQTSKRKTLCGLRRYARNDG